MLSGEYFFLADTKLEHSKVPYSLLTALSSFGGYLSLAFGFVKIIGRKFAVRFGIGRIIYLLHKTEMCIHSHGPE